MKSIELTKEHKAKLLEMCRVLFPEYTFIEWNLLGKRAWDAGYIKYYKDSDKTASFIHWFEFCMTHLSWKLQKQINKTVKDGEQISLYHRNDKLFHLYGTGKLCLHPIDYLYQEFKKLK